jgi:hypothetical protein
MIIVRGILQVLVVISAPSLVFVSWMLWRTRGAEDKAASFHSSPRLIPRR